MQSTKHLEFSNNEYCACEQQLEHGGRYPKGIGLFQVESKRPSGYQVMRLSPKWTQEVGGSAATVALGPGAQVCS